MLPEEARARLAGVGLALSHDATQGRSDDAYYKALQAEIEEQLGISVFVQNDITAAASGESMFGAAKPFADYMYFYLGAKLHGRLVLNHQIYKGNSPLSFDVGIDALEAELQAHNKPVDTLWERSGDWSSFEGLMEVWEARLISKMSECIGSLGQFLEFKTVILSSYAPQEVCRDICQKLEKKNAGIRAIAGNISPSPKAIGAASIPLSSRFMVE